MANTISPAPSRHRALLVVQSVAAIAIGVLAFIWPGATLGALLILFGVFLIVFGSAALVGAFATRRKDPVWWLGLVAGLAGVVVGVLTLIWPGLTAITLLYLIAAWAMLMGVAEMVYAIRSRQRKPLRVAYGVAGFLSVALGIVLIAIRPELGVLAVLWLIGLYAMINGILWGYCAIVGGRPISIRRSLTPGREIQSRGS